jgi:hypothetical protein
MRLCSEDRKVVMSGKGMSFANPEIQKAYMGTLG